MTYKTRDCWKSFEHRAHKKAVVIAHRRAGKTLEAAIELVACARMQGNQRLAYITPRPHDTAWDYFETICRRNLFARILIRAKINKNKGRITFPNGSTIQLFSANDPDALRGRYFDGVVFDNAEYIATAVYKDVIRPALIDRNGWVAFLGSERKGLLGDMFDKALSDMGAWFVQVLPVSVTCLISREDLASFARVTSVADVDVKL